MLPQNETSRQGMLSLISLILSSCGRSSSGAGVRGPRCRWSAQWPWDLASRHSGGAWTVTQNGQMFSTNSHFTTNSSYPPPKPPAWEGWRLAGDGKWKNRTRSICLDSGLEKNHTHSQAHTAVFQMVFFSYSFTRLLWEQESEAEKDHFHTMFYSELCFL